MTLIEKYRQAIVVLDNYVHNGWHGDTESDAIGFFFELEEKIKPRYAKDDIVKCNFLPDFTYEVIKVMFNFEDEEEYCHIANEYEYFIVKSKDLERIE